MPVTLEQILNYLDREEPDYENAAQLGPEALPHLMRLVQGENVTFAALAASLAGLIKSEQSAEVVEMATRHPEPVVRVAAAAALRNLREPPTSLAIRLLKDEEMGVRKWTLKALEVHRQMDLKPHLQEIAEKDPDITLRQLASQLVNRLQ
ncbi:HEAT repeat domain-containing protein [Nostoc sp. CHAB 5844]|nr:HEAT repeat domain-containing protein [Nostoc sp. CHAB 5844]